MILPWEVLKLVLSSVLSICMPYAPFLPAMVNFAYLGTLVIRSRTISASETRQGRIFSITISASVNIIIPPTITLLPYLHTPSYR